MKTVLQNFSLPLVFGAILLMAACNKKEETTLNNLKPYRTDESQATTINQTSISTDMVLEDRVNGVDYIIPHTLDVTANLTIKPGVTLMFDEGAGIVVRNNGSITAIGQDANEVYFTSHTAKRGGWAGITVLNTNAHNILDHCIIEQGGGDNVYGTGNIIIGAADNNARIAISNSEITASKTVGIRAGQGSIIEAFHGNKIHTNTENGLALYVADAATLTDQNTFTNNGKESVLLVSYGNLISRPVSIPKISIPYSFNEHIIAGNTFVIQAGNKIIMNENAAIIVDGRNGNGSFTAVGTATQPITIIGAYNNPGGWKFIQFNSTHSANNRLEYCVIDGGGGSTVSGEAGMISVTNQNSGTSAVTIRNNKIYNSANVGIYIKTANTQYNADIITANTFSGNLNGNTQFE